MSPARETVRLLQATGVTHVVGLPDNTSAPLFDALAGDPTICLVTVTREGEAFAIASGLWIGGAAPLVVIQNTGLLESGDGLRGTALRMGAAVPMIVTARGYAKIAGARLSPHTPRTVETLTRPDVDTAALFMEPTLDAWGVPFQLCEADDDPGEMLVDVILAARVHERPTALVLARPLA